MKEAIKCFVGTHSFKSFTPSKDKRENYIRTINYVSIKDETGLEVENGNVEEYAKAITKLANSKSLREKFAENAKNRVLNLFMEEQFWEAINSLLQEVIKWK